MRVKKETFYFLWRIYSSSNSLIMKLVISSLFSFLFLLNGFASDYEQHRFAAGTPFFNNLSTYYSIDIEEEALRDITYARLQLLDLEGVLNRAEPKVISHTDIMMAMTEFNVIKISNSEKLWIELDYLSDSEILIRNMNGKLMSKVVLGDLNKVLVEIDISRLPSGNYMVNDGITTIPFSKK